MFIPVMGSFRVRIFYSKSVSQKKNPLPDLRRTIISSVQYNITCLYFLVFTLKGIAKLSEIRCDDINIAFFPFFFERMPFTFSNTINDGFSSFTRLRYSL